MYSKYKIGFLRFFGFIVSLGILVVYIDAFSMGDPLRDSREANIFIFFDFKN